MAGRRETPCSDSLLPFDDRASVAEREGVRGAGVNVLVQIKK
jgi:hypothetical protein